jgi:hypothetical protein
MLCELKVRCRKCCKDYSLSDMPNDASGRFGVAPRCRGCRAKRIRDARVRVRAMKLPTPPEKRCGRCLVTKPKDEFHKDSGAKDGLFGHCKACAKDRRKGNWKPRVAAVTLEIPGKKVCPDCLLELPSSSFSVDAKRKDGLNHHCRSCASVRRAVSQYSLSIAEARAIRSSTACECCLKPISGSEVCIDHCHSTGVVRGALCGACNLMLGAAKDNTEILRAGAEYLERKRCVRGAS